MSYQIPNVFGRVVATYQKLMANFTYIIDALNNDVALKSDGSATGTPNKWAIRDSNGKLTATGFIGNIESASTINGESLTDIFESDGTTVKVATLATTATIATQNLLTTGLVSFGTVTLTYASANSFTTSEDMSSSLKVGFGFSCSNGGTTKYFYIGSISGTTVSVYGGTTTLTAGAITGAYYIPSPKICPSFPEWMDCATPTWEFGTSISSITVKYMKFKFDGTKCIIPFYVSFFLSGTDNSITMTGLPVTPDYSDSRYTDSYAMKGQYAGSGTWVIDGANQVSFYSGNSGSNWSTGYVPQYIGGEISYFF